MVGIRIIEIHAGGLCTSPLYFYFPSMTTNYETHAPLNLEAFYSVLIPVLCKGQYHVYTHKPGYAVSTHGVGTWGLGPAGLSRDDNLVNRKNCPGGLGRKLNGPLLRYQQIQDAVLLGV